MHIRVIVFLFGLGVLAVDSTAPSTSQCTDYDDRLANIEKQVLENSKVKAELNEYKTRVQQLEKMVSAQKNTSKRLVLGESAQVSFSTVLTIDHHHIGIGQTIKYNTVLINDGAGYSIHSGVFTAPVSGVYMFMYMLGHGSEPAQVWLELMHNGGRINSGISDTFHNNEDLQGGNMAIFRVNAGDSVWIESFHQSDSYLNGGSYRFTTFSGVLLY